MTVTFSPALAFRSLLEQLTPANGGAISVIDGGGAELFRLTLASPAFTIVSNTASLNEPAQAGDVTASGVASAFKLLSPQGETIATGDAVADLGVSPPTLAAGMKVFSVSLQISQGSIVGRQVASSKILPYYSPDPFSVTPTIPAGTYTIKEIIIPYDPSFDTMNVSASVPPGTYTIKEVIIPYDPSFDTMNVSASVPPGTYTIG